MSASATTAADDTDTRCLSKRQRRALKTTVGGGLAVVAAVLLSHSDEVGEWLRAVAPHVLPHAGAGAEIVQRAIVGAQTCIHEGANVCLDAEGQITALCEWCHLVSLLSLS